VLPPALERKGGFHTFIAEETKGAIRYAGYLLSNSARQDIKGSPGVCEVVASKQGPLSLMPTILLIRIHWAILHAADVVCASTSI
jgi:hypothetical protein